MRIGAFASLPIGCVDLERMRVYQLPERGVLTKNRKAAITTLLQIPELLAVAKEWDTKVRSQLGEELCWYAHLDYQSNLSLDEPNRAALQNRKLGFGDDLHILCDLAGVEYKSAHKFRHGHAVYALKNCKTMEEFKSVSQNLMHANVGITDGIYGNLVEDDVHKTIMGLGGKDKPADTDLQAAFEEMIRKYAKGKD
jgi:integrase